MVFIEPDEEHWHSATAERFMADVAIHMADANGEVATLADHVTDEDVAENAEGSG